MQAVNPANIAMMNCSRKWKSRGNGLYALLISKQEEIIGLLKPLLPKSTLKPHFIHVTVVPLVAKSSNFMCIIYYSTNAIIVQSCLKCLLVAVPAAHTIKCTYQSVNCFISKLYTIYTNDHKYNMT